MKIKKNQAVRGTGLMHKCIKSVQCTAFQNPQNLNSYIGTLDETTFFSCKICILSFPKLRHAEIISLLFSNYKFMLKNFILDTGKQVLWQ